MSGFPWLLLGLLGCSESPDPSKSSNKHRPSDTGTSRSDSGGTDSATPDSGDTDTDTPDTAEPSSGKPPNIVVILLDDFGRDKVGAYAAHPAPPPTPNIDALAVRGLRFNNAYSSPTCSPSRSAILTGRLPSRTGIGNAIPPLDTDYDLPQEEVTIPEAFRAADRGYTSVVVGKWHLGTMDRPDPGLHPLQQGFDHHWGPYANPKNSISDISETLDYTYWEKNVDGVLSFETTYLTTDTTNDAIHHLETMEPPWFLYVAYNAPHGPFHTPPAELFSGDLGASPSDEEQYDAMVQALDTELGRLFAAIPDDTTIILAGDNGTPTEATANPWDSTRAKGTLYEGGVNIPFIVASPLVTDPGGTRDALVHLTDVFSTALDLADADPGPQPLDGQSLVPILSDPSYEGRTYLYAEAFSENGAPPYDVHDRMIRDAQYKYMRFTTFGATHEALFYLDPDAMDEGENLLIGTPEGEIADVYERLQAELTRAEDSLTYDYE